MCDASRRQPSLPPRRTRFGASSAFANRLSLPLTMAMIWTACFCCCCVATAAAAAAFVSHPPSRPRLLLRPSPSRSFAFSWPSMEASASTALRASSSSSSSSSPSNDRKGAASSFKHMLAILTLPRTSSDRIGNDAILETALTTMHGRGKLSVVLRSNTGGGRCDGEGHYGTPTVPELRRYVGDVYSAAWDAALGLDRAEGDEVDMERDGLPDVIVYPQNLPNAAPEVWINHRSDLDCVCSHDTITGWITDVGDGAGGTGKDHVMKAGEGVGGLDEHVRAVNADRRSRGLKEVVALHVDPWPIGAIDGTTGVNSGDGENNVIFLEDEDDCDVTAMLNAIGDSEDEEEVDDAGLLGGTALPPGTPLYDQVAVGGTFDGMHYGHRKLLTLAVSSVQPRTGKLLVGVTDDAMLTSKSFANLIPPLNERIAGVKDFLGNLAPGMKNRIKVVTIKDSYGPPGQRPEQWNNNGEDFDALVLSHETLPTGVALNEHRVKHLGLKPLTLLCTRRTEPHGMSSTALRRMRASSMESSMEKEEKEVELVKETVVVDS